MCRIGRLGSWLVVMIFERLKYMPALKRATESCLMLAEEKFNIPLLDVPVKFKWLRGLYGQAESQSTNNIYQRAEIRYGLHSMYFLGEAFPHILKETVPHEVAHVVQHYVYADEVWNHAPHGPEWLEIFKSLGGTDERYFEGGTHYEA